MAQKYYSENARLQKFFENLESGYSVKNTSGESPEIFQEISTRLKEVNNIVENTKFTLLKFGIFPSGSVVDAPSLHSLHKPGM